MTCVNWESCPYYARCEVIETDSCEQKHDCRWYHPNRIIRKECEEV